MNQSISAKILKEPTSKSIGVMLFFLLILEFFLWAWKGSGVLWMSYAQAIPQGYFGLLKNSYFGDWFLMKENIYYIHQHQAFLGVKNVFLERASGFEFMRSLYATLTTIFWFLSPLFSGLILNLILWGMTAYSARYICLELFHNHAAGWMGAFFVIIGQGFLHRVGEFSPHLMGHALGYWLGAFFVYAKLWEKESLPRNHLFAYGMIGVLKLAYESAWLYLPVLMILSFWGLRKRDTLIRMKISALGILLAIIPGGVLNILGLLISSTGSLKYNGLTIFFQDPTWYNFILFCKNYLISFFEGVFAYGPFLVLLALLGVLRGVMERNMIVLWIVALTFFQFFYTTFFIMTVSGKGYVTFALSPGVMCLNAYALQYLWKRQKYFAQTILLGIIIYNNSYFLGTPIPLKGFEIGYMTTLSSKDWYKYEVEILNDQ